MGITTKNKAYEKVVQLLNRKGFIKSTDLDEDLQGEFNTICKNIISRYRRTTSIQLHCQNRKLSEQRVVSLSYPYSRVSAVIIKKLLGVGKEYISNNFSDTCMVDVERLSNGTYTMTLTRHDW